MFIVVAYDITNDKRRNKVAKILLDYGERVQYSVFEAEITQELLNEILLRLQEVINTEEDSVRIYKICSRCLERVELMGDAKLAIPENVFVY